MVVELVLKNQHIGFTHDYPGQLQAYNSRRVMRREDVELILAANSPSTNHWRAQIVDQGEWDGLAFIESLASRFIKDNVHYGVIRKIRSFAQQPNAIYVYGGSEEDVHRVLEGYKFTIETYDGTTIKRWCHSTDYASIDHGSWVSFDVEEDEGNGRIYGVPCIGLVLKGVLFADIKSCTSVLTIPRFDGVEVNHLVDRAFVKDKLGDDYHFSEVNDDTFLMRNKVQDELRYFYRGMELLHRDVRDLSILSCSPTHETVSHFALAFLVPDLHPAWNYARMHLDNFLRTNRFSANETVKIVEGKWCGYTAMVCSEESSTLPQNEVMVCLQYAATVEGGSVRVKLILPVSHIRKELKTMDRVVAKNNAEFTGVIAGWRAEDDLCVVEDHGWRYPTYVDTSELVFAPNAALNM